MLFSDYVPFKEFLVYPDSRQQVDPPEYIDKIKHPPDWEIIYKKEALVKFSREDVSPSNYSLTKDFEDLRLNISSSEAKPDETQLTAIAMALKHRVILIQVLVNSVFYFKVCSSGGPLRALDARKQCPILI